MIEKGKVYVKESEEEVKVWAKKHIIDEYTLFAGPYGRRIATRLKKYKKRCWVLLYISIAEFSVISAIVYVFVNAYLATKG